MMHFESNIILLRLSLKAVSNNLKSIEVESSEVDSKWVLEKCPFKLGFSSR